MSRVGGTRSRGGYRPDSRLATNGDELVITAMEWFKAPTPEDRKRAKGELAQLVLDRIVLLASLNVLQPLRCLP